MQFFNELPWHTALQTSTIDFPTLRSCDPNLKDFYGFSALHLYILSILYDTKKSCKINYKTIVFFLDAGFDLDSQCHLGFTSLCLTQFAKFPRINDLELSRNFLAFLSKSSPPTVGTNLVLRDVSFILMDYGATLKTNSHNFSPLSYTQLYYHLNPHRQRTLITRYPRNIEIKELYKLSLLKAVTPEKNYNSILITTVKHGIPFPHQSVATELSPESIIRILIEILRLFGTKSFSCPYNLPSYQSEFSIEEITSFRGNELEIIGAVCSFFNSNYKTSNLLEYKSSKHRIFIVLTIFIALWEILVYRDEGNAGLMKLLSTILRSDTALHLLIFTKEKWLDDKCQISKHNDYFGKFVSLIYNGLWYRVTGLMVNQVNNRNEDGFTPLHIAARVGDLEMILYLIDKLGAYPYTLNSKGRYFYQLDSNQLRKRKQTPQIRKVMDKFIFQVKTLQTLSAITICKYNVKYPSLPKKSFLYSFIGLHSRSLYEF